MNRIPDVEPVMPNGSYWPILTALGVAATWGLLLTGIWWTPLVGLVYTMFCVFNWVFEDPFARRRTNEGMIG